MNRKAAITGLILVFLFILIIHTGYADESYDYYIKVNRATNCVTVYDSSDMPVKAMVCSVGADGSTPLGTFNTSQKLRWHYLFGDEYGQYCTRIVDDILFHSVPYFSQNEDDINAENYNMLGQADSLGCVRLAVIDAKWIYDNCPVGTEVTIFDGTEADDPLGKPEAVKLGENAPYSTWDPTDPSENNPYNNMSINITADKRARFIYQNKYQSDEWLLNYLKTGVRAYDAAGNEIDFEVETDASPSKCGAYDVVYIARDALGTTYTLAAKFVVLPSVMISDASVNPLVWKKDTGCSGSSFYGGGGAKIITSKAVRVVYQNNAQNDQWLSEYLSSGVKAYDEKGRETDFRVETNIDQDKAGIYEAVYIAEDENGQTTKLKTEVWVLPSQVVSNMSMVLCSSWADNTYDSSPEITIISEKHVRTIYQNSHQNKDWLMEYLRYGVTAVDKQGNELDFDVITEADPSKCGTYDVIYRAADQNGNLCRFKTRFMVLPSKLISEASMGSV